MTNVLENLFQGLLHFETILLRGILEKFAIFLEYSLFDNLLSKKNPKPDIS